ncbi:MAG: hypothetical protein JNK57_09125 [Planctomycetaceae bacterium]|nr:hypothetical protein [Planctomycetaceae bacterium]
MFTNRTIRPLVWAFVASILFLPACAAKTKAQPEKKPNLTLREFLQTSDESGKEGVGGGSFRFPD